MDNYALAIGSAMWLGILTSISPCPLATNIAAISYISRRVGSPSRVITSGLLYTIGRMTTYLIIGTLIVTSVLSIPQVALFLQHNMNRFLGPVLIVVGLFLLDVIPISLPGNDWGVRLQSKVERFGVWGAGLLGMLFALSFCPVSAGLFFGSLIPLALEYQSHVVMPTVFGIGTALPVFVFAIIIAVSARMVGGLFNKLQIFEKWARRITAVVFISAGVYYSLIYWVGLEI